MSLIIKKYINYFKRWRNEKIVLSYFLKPHLRIVIEIVLLLIFSAFLETISIGSFFPLINGFLAENSSSQTNIAGMLRHFQTLSQSLPFKDPVISSAIFLLLIFFVSSVTTYLIQCYIHIKRYDLMMIYFQKIFSKMISNHYNYFTGNKNSDLLYVGTNASQAVGEMLLYFPRLLNEVLKAIFLLFFLFAISFKTTFLVVFALLLFALITNRISKRFIHPLAKRIQIWQTEITNHFTEAISCIKLIKVFNLENVINERSYKTLVNNRIDLIKSAYCMIFPSPFAMLLTALGLSGSIIFLRLYHASEFYSVIPVLAMYVLALQRLLVPASNISIYWLSLVGLMPRLKITYDHLTDVKHLENTFGTAEVKKINHAISISQIFYSYTEGQNILENISISIPAGKTIAIVGDSGSGKTTLLNILLRFYLPQKGSIKFDSEPYENLTQKSFSELVSLVPQEALLFNTTIMENLSLANPKATIAEIHAACKNASAHDFINTLPDAYDTLVGDQGARLSGGQRQRIALARAFLRETPILILDEATSGLDNPTEQTIMENLRLNFKTKTVIIVTHRLTSIAHVDKIFVLNHGQIHETGTHEELIEKKGHYYKMFLRSHEDE